MATQIPPIPGLRNTQMMRLASKYNAPDMGQGLEQIGQKSLFSERGIADWPEQEEYLRSILERRPVYREDMPPAEKEWLMGTFAPEVMRQRQAEKQMEFQERYKREQDLYKKTINTEKFIDSIDKQIATLQAKEDLENKEQLIRSAVMKRNRAVKELDSLLGQQEIGESGLPIYKYEKGKLTFEGEVPKAPTDYTAILEMFTPAQQVREVPSEYTGPVEEAVPGPAGIMVPEFAREAPPDQMSMQHLQELDVELAAAFGDEVAEVIRQINQQTQDPNQRRDMALAALESKNPNSVTAQKIRRAQAAQTFRA